MRRQLTQEVLGDGQAAVMENLRSKEQIRDSLRTQLDAQTHNFSSMERDARSLLLRATHAGGKVSVSFIKFPALPASSFK